MLAKVFMLAVEKYPPSSKPYTEGLSPDFIALRLTINHEVVGQPPAIFCLELYRNLENFFLDSEVFELTPLRPEQRDYKEPFGIDCMQPEQWLMYIYLPELITRLHKNQIDALVEQYPAILPFFDEVWLKKKGAHPDYEKAVEYLIRIERCLERFYLLKVK